VLHLLGQRRRSCPRRAAVVATACLVAGLVALTAVVPAASASATAAGSLTLTSQTSWLSGQRNLALGLTVRSNLPTSELGIRLVLYSCLGSRSAFQSAIRNGQTSNELVLDAPPTIALDQLSPTGSSRHVALTVAIRAGSTAPTTITTQPTLALSCANGGESGVYPLQIRLVDTARERPLATITTPLVYSPTAVSSPLTTAVVVPMGTSPALAPAAFNDRVEPSQLRPATTVSDEHVAATLLAYRGASVSLELYPQLLVALARTPGAAASSALASLRALASTGSDELLPTPFAAVNPAALTGSLEGQFAEQLARATPTFTSILGATPTAGDYITNDDVNAATIAMLEANGAHDLVLPESSYALDGGGGLTQTAPFVLSTGSGTQASLVATGADPELSSYFSNQSDPVLAAHQLLGELAQIYFDLPDAAQPRGIVVAPTSWAPNAAFLNALLIGLQASPVLTASTLSSLFSSVPVGANSDVAGATVTSGDVGHLDADAINRARAMLQTTASVVPGATGLLGGLRDSILLSETAGLSSSTRNRYAGAPAHVLSQIAGSISFGRSAITLTSQHAKVPITLFSNASGAVHGVLELSSSALGFPAGASLPLTLTHKDNPNFIRVTARSSGDFHLSASFVSPDHHATLVRTIFTVRSTAVSGVAIGISLGALAVLGIWWVRSVARHRRRTRAQRAAHSAAA
jgi:hypothetical protein